MYLLSASSNKGQYLRYIIVRIKNYGLESRKETYIFKIWSSHDQTECKSLFTFPCIVSYIAIVNEALQNFHLNIFIKSYNSLIIIWN